MKKIFIATLLATTFSLPLLAGNLTQDAKNLESKVIDWRRDFHQHPELGNRETRTAAIVAKHLQSLGMEVETGIGYTGVVGILKGGKPGTTVALRADMDALPVTEQVDLPFASKVTTSYRGVESGVMHACGHDTHVAMLMGAAELLASKKDQLQGKVMFIFQPAEEGAPMEEEGGAELMLKEGIFKKHKPSAIYGLHVGSQLPAGMVGYREGPLMASADRFEMKVNGVQTHGSSPWGGIDPIVVASQIVMATQTIISRQIDISKAPAVISFGKIAGGIRNNIIPESVELVGTIRNFNMDTRKTIFEKLKLTAKNVAESAGTTVDVTIYEGYPVTINDPKLTEASLLSVKRVFGDENVIEVPLIMGAEDFSFFALEIPGFYFFMGATPKGEDPAKAPSNHSPLFFVDESILVQGTEALSQLAIDYLDRQAQN